MINVPERVKDALRSGEYRKNVKIKWTEIGTYTHVYDDTEITIEKGLNPSEDWVWYLDNSYIDVPVGCTKVVMAVESTLISDASYGSSYYTPSLNPEVFEIKDGWTYITIDTPTTGNVLIDITSFTEYSSVTISMDNVDVERVIDNNNLVAESVKFDERMCSDTELKFGLCEGTSVEFQYFDFPNINGHAITIDIDVQYKDEHGELMWYTIPMGHYEVKECSRQASTGIIKATAFNKLQSNYLDRDVLAQILYYIGGPTQTKSIVDILNYLLNGYHIEKTDWEEVECQLCRESNPEDAIGTDYLYENVYYKAETGSQWTAYTKSGYFPQEYPYDVPTGNRWVIYAATFSFRPSNDTGSASTTHYYKIDDVQLQAIWEIVKKNLYYFYDYDENYFPTGRVVKRATDPRRIEPFMPTTGPYFGMDGGVYGIDFVDYAVQHALDVDANDYVTGYFGQMGYGGGTTVVGHTEPYDCPEFTGYYPKIRVPIAIVVQKDDYHGSPPVPFQIQAVWNQVLQLYEATYQAICGVALPKMYKKILSPIEEERISYEQVASLNQLTLRELQSAVFEVDCQYGKLDRESDLFAGIELNNARLYPADNLYPADDLFPMGTAEAGYPSMYSKLWADEGNVRSFRYLNVTYKGTDNGQEVDKVIQRTVNANGTDDYNMSDNWLFKNLVWSDADVGAYADAMVAKMQNIRWFPFEMWCAGLPYLEAGDEIEIAMKEGTYPSYILRRTLSGIQNLQDELIDGTLDIF